MFRFGVLFGFFLCNAREAAMASHQLWITVDHTHPTIAIRLNLVCPPFPVLTFICGHRSNQFPHYKTYAYSHNADTLMKDELVPSSPVALFRACRSLSSRCGRLLRPNDKSVQRADGVMCCCYCFFYYYNTYTSICCIRIHTSVHLK